MSDTIFEQSQDQETSVVNVQPNTPSVPQELIELVGEGKKYKSVEDALKSVPHAQKHINTLEQELAQIKEELAKRRTTEELLDELKSGVTPIEKTSPAVIDQDKIVSVVQQAIEQRERVKVQQTNVNTVISSFENTYGEKAKDMYVKLASDSGLSLEYLNSLAATSPTAVLKLAGLTKTEQPVPSKIQGSSINTEALKPTTNEQTARVGNKRTTKDIVEAWRIAGQKVKQTQS